MFAKLFSRNSFFSPYLPLILQEDILDKYKDLDNKPTSPEAIHHLTENLEQFAINPVKAEVIIKMISLVSHILSDMQKNHFPLSKEEITEESSEQAGLLNNACLM